jgi:ribosomal protein L4
MPGERFQGACSVSGYDLLVAQHIVMTEEALREIEGWLCTAVQLEQQEEETASHE